MDCGLRIMSLRAKRGNLDCGLKTELRRDRPACGLPPPIARVDRTKQTQFPAWPGGAGPGDGGRGIIAQNKPNFLPGSRRHGAAGAWDEGQMHKQTQFPGATGRASALRERSYGELYIHGASAKQTQFPAVPGGSGLRGAGRGRMCKQSQFAATPRGTRPAGRGAWGFVQTNPILRLRIMSLRARGSLRAGSAAIWIADSERPAARRQSLQGRLYKQSQLAALGRADCAKQSQFGPPGQGQVSGRQMRNKAKRRLSVVSSR